jgi:quinol monooxygenase YgiN
VIVAIGDVRAQIPQRAAVEAAMRRAQTAALEEDGCLSFAFAAALDDPGRYVLVQRWSDLQAMEAHYGSDAFREYQQEIAPLLVRDSELEVHVVEGEARFVDSARIRIDQDD